jgi:hypothetical protein
MGEMTRAVSRKQLGCQTLLAVLAVDKRFQLALGSKYARKCKVPREVEFPSMIRSARRDYSGVN